MNADNKFVIAQLGDLMNTGVPADYIRTQAVIENLVQNVQPDLIVITGDSVDPTLPHYEALYKQAMQYIVDSGIPWVWTGGS